MKKKNLSITTDMSWVEAISKYFEMVGLCAHFEILRATPAIEFKKQAMDSIIKKLKALDAPNPDYIKIVPPPGTEA